MRIPQWFVFAWVVVIGLVAVGGALFSYTFVRARAAELDSVLELPSPPQLFSNAPQDQPASDNPGANTTATPQATPAPADTGAEASATESAAVGELLEGQPSKWSDPRRVNVVLLGIDQRKGEQGPFPTDTIIMVSFDPAGNTGAILSIPRDLWVDFPGIKDPGRINTANILGDEINYPGGAGPALAMKTVERLLGENIKYYVLINFDVFTALIDAVGPIEVCPPEPIDDDAYPDGSYGMISIHFDAGCQELGSERLLQYARTRHGDSDIGRSSRQQEVILAVRNKVLSMGGVLDLLPKAASLWESMQANIRTNMTFDQMVSLALSAENVPRENIRQGQITFEDVYTSTTPNGDQILVPISTDIRILVDDLFRPAGMPSSQQ